MVAARTAAAAEGSPNETLPEFIDSRRVYLALEASWQASACASAALAMLAKADADQVVTESTLRALLLRVITLADSTAEVLDDEGIDLAEVRSKLMGAQVV